MPTEDKWKANMEKVAFTKQFPGLTLDWKGCEHKTIETVIPLTGKPSASVIVFTDGSFTVAPLLLGQALLDARTHLGPKHREAYEEFDRLTKKDKETLRAARLEKIIGAIHNNIGQIPELKDRLKELVKEWT
jgi:diglucosylglycerate octanoyltransferase